jgi:hypothetical protein
MALHPNGHQTLHTRNQSVQRIPTDQNAIQTPPNQKCYDCGQKGHFTILCPNPRARPPLTPIANSTPPPNRNGNSTPIQAKQNYARGKVNKVTMMEAQNNPTMLYLCSTLSSLHYYLHALN